MYLSRALRRLRLSAVLFFLLGAVCGLFLIFDDSAGGSAGNSLRVLTGILIGVSIGMALSYAAAAAGSFRDHHS